MAPSEARPDARSGTPVPGPTSAADAERVRLRYPGPRVPRLVWIVAVALVAALAGTWLVWAATVGTRPPVSAVISAYTVRSDTEIVATLTMSRADPGKPAACRVLAQAEDFQPVAEQTVRVPPAAGTTVDVEVVLTTLRRATTAVVKECSLI